MKFIRKPEIVEAIQYTGINSQEIFLWCGLECTNRIRTHLKGEGQLTVNDRILHIKLGESFYIKASPRDWIVKKPNEKIFVMKPEVFAEYYEEQK